MFDDWLEQVPSGCRLIMLPEMFSTGFTMASNYNTRPRGAEVLVDGDRYDVVRQRETVDQLLELESVPAGLER